MRKKKPTLNETERLAREEAALAVIKASRKPLPFGEEVMQGFEGMSRHRISQFMARERMRAEAEEKRGRTDRANDARWNMARAKQALKFIDAQAAA